MRFFAIMLFVLTCAPYAHAYDCRHELEQGKASWYGPKFDGKPTASGEIFQSESMTAAHPTLPFGSIVKVVNPKNQRSVIVKINDRGNFASTRIIDLSRSAAREIGIMRKGIATVSLYACNQ